MAIITLVLPRNFASFSSLVLMDNFLRPIPYPLGGIKVHFILLGWFPFLPSGLRTHWRLHLSSFILSTLVSFAILLSRT